MAKITSVTIKSSAVDMDIENPESFEDLGTQLRVAAVTNKVRCGDSLRVTIISENGGAITIYEGNALHCEISF
jgi:hypothetical protein